MRSQSSAVWFQPATAESRNAASRSAADKVRYTAAPNTFVSVEIHGGRPGLILNTHWLRCHSVMPFVEASCLVQPGKSLEGLVRIFPPSGFHQCRNVEAADKW